MRAARKRRGIFWPGRAGDGCFENPLYVILFLTLVTVCFWHDFFRAHGQVLTFQNLNFAAAGKFRISTLRQPMVHKGGQSWNGALDKDLKLYCPRVYGGWYRAVRQTGFCGIAFCSILAMVFWSGCAVIGDGIGAGRQICSGLEGDGDRLARHFACPLVTVARRTEWWSGSSTGFLADVTDVGQTAPQLVAIAVAGAWGDVFLPWRIILHLMSSERQVYILVHEKDSLSSRPGAPASPRSKPPSKNARSQPLPYLQGPLRPLGLQGGPGPAASNAAPAAVAVVFPLELTLLGFLGAKSSIRARQLPGSGAPGVLALFCLAGCGTRWMSKPAAIAKPASA